MIMSMMIVSSMMSVHDDMYDDIHDVFFYINVMF